jgi:sporulation protein YlmC with PRC-barrel domain
MRKILFASVAVVALGACGTIENLTGRGDDAQPVAMGDTRALGALAASELMDMNVVGRDGAKIGEVDDVLVDRQGRPQRVVIQRGGVLGIGGKEVALDVDNLRHAPSRQALVATEVTAATADRLPEATSDGNLVSLSKTAR